MTAIAASGIPNYLSPYSFGTEQDMSAHRRSCEAELEKQDESLKSWLVTCVFSSEPIKQPPDIDSAVDPVLLPAEISGDFVARQIEPTVDKDGDPIVNSAGEPFDGLTDEEYHPALTITQNFNSINLQMLSEFIGAVNSTTFFGLGPRMWRLERAPWRQEYRSSNVPYYRVTFEFTANWDTWDLKPLDRGWHYLSSGNKCRFVDKDGLPLNRPGLLNGSGGQLAVGSDPVYLTFRRRREVNFGLLGIPTHL